MDSRNENARSFGDPESKYYRKRTQINRNLYYDQSWIDYVVVRGASRSSVPLNRWEMGSSSSSKGEASCALR